MNDVKITFIEGRQLGRCYSSTRWLVESPRPLEAADFAALRAARRLGYGQEFYTKDLGAVDGIFRYTAEDRVDSGD